MKLVLAFVVTLAIFAAIDTLWLGAMAGRIYRPLIGDMLADRVRLIPALAFYVLYAAGLVVFAVSPGLRDGGWMGEGRPKGGHALAILPGLTHYNLAVSPLFVDVTQAFLDAPD